MTDTPVLYGYSLSMRFLGTEEVNLPQVHFILQGSVQYCVVQDIGLWRAHVAKLNEVQPKEVTFAMMATALSEAHLQGAP